MDEKKQFSIFIRLICGVFGILGIATIIFNFNRTGEFEVGFLSLASMFALFIFLFVAMKCTPALRASIGPAFGYPFNASGLFQKTIDCHQRFGLKEQRCMPPVGNNRTFQIRLDSGHALHDILGKDIG